MKLANLLWENAKQSDFGTGQFILIINANYRKHFGKDRPDQVDKDNLLQMFGS